MVWALIINNIVHELTETDPTGRFSKDMTWVSVPAGITVEQGYSYASGVFTAPAEPTFSDVKALRTSAIQSVCQSAILGGFTSSSLGSAYNYPSDDNSQRNIAMAAAAGGSIWCEAGSTWAMVPHTVTQAQQVQKDLFTMIQANQGRYAKLVAEIGAATTSTAVEAITW